MKLAKKLFRKKDRHALAFRFAKSKNKSFTALSKRLQKRSEHLLAEFTEKHKDALDYLEKKGFKVDEIVDKGSRGAATGLAASIVLLSSGIIPSRNLPAETKPQKSTVATQVVSEVISKQDKSQALIKLFNDTIPTNTKGLDRQTEDKLSSAISKTIGFNVTSELSGNHLNTIYGKIGLEQHLPRYPGETIQNHFENPSSFTVYGKSGLTKNKGAFGYFANNRYSLTQEAIEQEKYYVVVQTFDIPGWNKEKWNWYKHRKVLVVNTENGRAVVGAIADAGPAKWTGKSFGGSPELMDNLQMYRGSRKAKVLIFFINDGQENAKLGPI